MARFTFASLFLAILSVATAQTPTASPIYAPTTAPVYGPSVSPTDAPTFSVDDTLVSVDEDIAGADFSGCGSSMSVTSNATGALIPTTNVIESEIETTIITPSGSNTSDCVEAVIESALTPTRRALLATGQSVLSVETSCEPPALCATGVGAPINAVCEVCTTKIFIQNGVDLITSAPTVKSGKGSKSGKGTSAPTAAGTTKAPTVKSGKGGKAGKSRMRV
jgi:hypothetical protein